MTAAREAKQAAKQFKASLPLALRNHLPDATPAELALYNTLRAEGDSPSAAATTIAGERAMARFVRH